MAEMDCGWPTCGCIVVCRDGALDTLCELRTLLTGIPGDTLVEQVRALLADRARLHELTQAALTYDAAIQRYASHGKSWVDGDDLNALYADWITKAQAASSAEHSPGGLT